MAADAGEMRQRYLAFKGLAPIAGAALGGLAAVAELVLKGVKDRLGTSAVRQDPRASLRPAGVGFVTPG